MATEGNDDASTALIAVEEQIESVDLAADGHVKNPPLARKKRQTCGVLCRVSSRFSCAIVCSILDDELAIDACDNMCGGPVMRERISPLTSCPGCGVFHKPVCGSDRITYRNACWGFVKICITNLTVGVSIVRLGPCYSYSSSSEACFYPFIYEPVCGNDGHEYNNLCLLQCAGAFYVGPAEFPD